MEKNCPIAYFSDNFDLISNNEYYASTVSTCFIYNEDYDYQAEKNCKIK